MKNLIVFIILIMVILVTDSYGKKPIKKSLYTVLVRNESSSIETFDGGLTYQLINTNIIKEALQTNSQCFVPKDVNCLAGILNFFPNPVQNSATLKYELKEGALIDIYTIDNYHNKQVHFSGLKDKGIHDAQINFNEVQKGLVLFYLEINGIVSIYKVIKM